MCAHMRTYFMKVKLTCPMSNDGMLELCLHVVVGIDTWRSRMCIQDRAALLHAPYGGFIFTGSCSIAACTIWWFYIHTRIFTGAITHDVDGCCATASIDRSKQEQ